MILVEEGTITVSLNGRKVLSAADTMTKAGTAALVMEGDAKVGGVRVQRPGDEDVPGGSGSGGSSDIENPNTSARLPLYVTLVLAAAGSARGDRAGCIQGHAAETARLIPIALSSFWTHGTGGSRSRVPALYPEKYLRDGEERELTPAAKKRYSYAMGGRGLFRRNLTLETRGRS